MLPNLSIEKLLWRKSFKKVAGVDEVGRGSFAGPVVAGAVVFPPNFESIIPKSIRIDDSKKLTSKQREKASIWIYKNALSWGVGEASTSQINKFGIKKATEIAFRKAISKIKPDYLLIDAFFIPYVKGLRRKNQKAIVNGDEKSTSIAAASIIAKVYRDELMVSLGKKPKYRKYGWVSNKGYGTKEHQKAIRKYGLSKYHRLKFVRKITSG